MALQVIWAFIIATLFCVATTQETPSPCTSGSSSGTCSASVSVQPTQPGHGSFIYNNIIVTNTGSCGITRVFVDITLPPYETPFAYYNVSNQTGELFGLSNPMPAGSSQTGGTIVLNSARTPIVELGSVECDPACSGGSSQAARSFRSPRAPIQPESESAKVEVQWGSNPWWIAIHLIGDAGATKEVRMSDAKSVSKQVMKREVWGKKQIFTFSGAQMELPISLELKSIADDTITLNNVITTFSRTVVDTGLSYTNNKVNIVDDEVELQVHPDSTPNWIGIAPHSAQNVTHVSLKAQNTDWIPMQQISPGFFELASPKMEIQLPISVKIAFSDGESRVFENTVVEFRQ